MQTKETNAKRDERKIWQSVFNNPQGKYVLISMLNRFGYFAEDVRAISPESISHANWLLNQIGIVNMHNLDGMVTKMLESASFRDIDEWEKSLDEMTGGEDV